MSVRLPLDCVSVHQIKECADKVELAGGKKGAGGAAEKKEKPAAKAAPAAEPPPKASGPPKKAPAAKVRLQTATCQRTVVPLSSASPSEEGVFGGRMSDCANELFLPSHALRRLDPLRRPRPLVHPVASQRRAQKAKRL